MNLSTKIKKHLLNVALKRPAPQRVPRSGSEAKAVNCYTVRVFKDGNKGLIIESMTNSMLDCIEFDEGRNTVKSEHEFESLLDYEFEFTHFHGLVTIKFSGWLDFALGHFFKFIYIRVWLESKKDDLLQFVYNRKKIVTKQRVVLLKTILDTQLNGADYVSVISVMSVIYTDRLFSHPSWEDYLHYTELYLDALASTGELNKANGDYSITGLGISAIERYEEEERKHSEHMSSQRRMFWLTFVIAALTLVQANVVKLPVLIDLTK